MNFRKFLFSFLLLSVGLTAFGQTDNLKQAKREFREEKQKDYDITLPPIQRVFTRVSDVTALESWAFTALEFKAYEAQLIQRLRATPDKKKVLVYVFDTAGEPGHPYLQKGYAGGKNFSDDPDLVDGHGHGTFVAGEIAGVDPAGWSVSNKIAAAGILVDEGWLRFKLLKVLNKGGSAMFSWITNAVLWGIEDAKQYPGEVIVFTMSLGGNSDDPQLSAALAKAKAAGIIITVAAGNTSGRGVQSPGRDNSVEAIAALAQTADGRLERASYSTFGPEIKIAAPGTGVLSTIIGGGFGNSSGTSMATPLVAAMYAWARVLHPKCSAGQITKFIQAKALDLPPTGWDEYTGYGIFKASGLLESSDAFCSTPDPGPGPDPTPDPKPDPKPDPVTPDPVKPERVLSVSQSDVITITWRASNGTTYNKTNVVFDYSFKSTKAATKAAKEMGATILEHFTNRGYVLLTDADDLDAAYWSSYFLELIFKKDRKILLNVDRVAIKDNPSLYLLDPVAGKNLSYSKAMKQGVFTVDYSKASF